jgi:hypothetical protein
MNTMPLHPWVSPISLAYLPRTTTPALQQAVTAVFDWLRTAGCEVTDQPYSGTDVIITTAQFGETVHRDEALLFHAKRRYRLSRRPQILTVVDIAEDDYQRWLRHFERLAQLPEEEAHQDRYPGLGPQAAEVISHQARRGGPVLAVSRLLQAQMISIRVMALRTEQGRPYRAMHFDLAGARPVSDATDLEAFGAEAGARILSAVCAHEVNAHAIVDDPVPAAVWAELEGPDAMMRAGLTFTEYGFFTSPFHIEKILGYRGISDAISAQFSEGCYAVYEPDIPGLLTTATGSSRLVDKRAITRQDQAVVVGVKPGRDGALVRPVEGMESVVPSVEAVEMMGLCQAVPAHVRVNRRGEPVTTPNARAVLHGHLGVERFDPAHVEVVRLDPLFYTQLVSCGTGPLANGTAAAFAASEALRSLDDPRRVVFLEQPGHGVMVVEKWPAADEPARPFDLIRRALEAGHLVMSYDIAQGPVTWVPDLGADGRPIMRRVLDVAPEALATPLL